VREQFRPSGRPVRGAVIAGSADVRVEARAFRPPQTVGGRYVELVPLAREHAAELVRASADPEVRRFLVLPPGPSLAATEAVVATLLARQAAGTDLPFTTRLRGTGEVVGMTRFLHIDAENESVEIGGTFVARPYWRTPVNTDAKLAMLRHAFEVGRVHRVTLQTDLRNERSQAAIARLGAVREGAHREDRLLPSGVRRTSVFFSILASEWPGTRDKLLEALARPWTPGSVADGGTPGPAAGH
jgi:RimJ/RimL family protein N-acetyltransferase